MDLPPHPAAARALPLSTDEPFSHASTSLDWTIAVLQDLDAALFSYHRPAQL